MAVERRKILAVRAWSLIFTILISAFIFSNSQDNSAKSDEKSNSITDKVAPFVINDYKTLPNEVKTVKKENLNHHVRKFAHVTEYLALGFCVSFFAFTLVKQKREQPEKQKCMEQCGRTEQPKRPGKGMEGRLGAALLFCLVYACSDEFHQYFISGRSGQIKDVILDFTGALMGTLIAWGIARSALEEKEKSRRISSGTL